MNRAISITVWGIVAFNGLLHFANGLFMLIAPERRTATTQNTQCNYEKTTSSAIKRKQIGIPGFE